MDSNPSSVEITFQDLSDTLINLLESRNNPRKTRQHFSQFINLSKKLTSHMRGTTENGIKVDLGKFSKWNDTSALFYHVLRNKDVHEKPLTLNIQYTYIFKNLGISPEPNEIRIIAHWSSDNPLDEGPNLEFEFGNQLTKEIYHLDKVILQYDLGLENEYFEKIGHKDVHKLAQDYFDILKLFVEFYKTEIGENH